MASTLKRRRGPVSYKEPSSDEGFTDLSDESEQEIRRRRKRLGPQRRSTRNQSSKAEQSSSGGRRDDDAAAPRTVRNKVLRGKRRISYQEDTTDDESMAGSDFEESAPTTPAKRQRSCAPASRGRKKKKSSSERPRSKALGAPRKPKRGASPISGKVKTVPSDGKIPPWSTLPYHILLQIFVYASHPLYESDEFFWATASIAWLAQVARMCTAFVKPALTALYRNPPIFALRRQRRALVEHLISPPSNPFVDYKVMVKRLELDATQMSNLTDPNNSLSDLTRLLSSFKTLKEVDIFDPYDRPPYRERARGHRKWYYPEELFDALKDSDLHLHSWRWNSNFCSRKPLWMTEVHSTAAFQRLRELSLTRFRSSTTTTEKGPTTEELLGSALAALPNLKRLTFESCTCLSSGLFSLLPKDLVSLNITNCKELESDTLEAFLLTHGSHLEELILNHNQSLDLSFLTTLKQTAPRLEVLRMDMHYYNTLSLSSDNEPLYDELLNEAEVPTWPSTLRTIDLEFLRNWTHAAAVMFFTSLIDSAEELPWLQEIIITAIVDIGWRQRAEFREEWTRRFQQVFARKWSPPNPGLASLKAFREWKESPSYPDAPPTVDRSDADAATITEDTNLARKWNSRRLRERRTRSGAYEESTDSESATVHEPSSEDIKYVQGRCHTVVFRVDNSRPQEQIYDEEDFLDEEISGDEDWDGNDFEDDGYAW